MLADKARVRSTLGVRANPLLRGPTFEFESYFWLASDKLKPIDFGQVDQSSVWRSELRVEHPPKVAGNQRVVLIVLETRNGQQARHLSGE